VRKGDFVECPDCTLLLPVRKAKFRDKRDQRRIAQAWYEGGCLAILKSGDEKQASYYIWWRCPIQP